MILAAPGPLCVFYYCRTYYKAVRVGGEESAGHTPHTCYNIYIYGKRKNLCQSLLAHPRLLVLQAEVRGQTRRVAGGLEHLDKPLRGHRRVTRTGLAADQV